MLSTRPEVEERWRLASNAPEYEVSDSGHVRRQRNGKSCRTEVRSSDGMYVAYLTVNGKGTTRSVGRMVLESFDGLPAYAKHHPRKANVSYKDGDAANCKLSNLEWVQKRKSHNAYVKAREEAAHDRFCERFDDKGCPNKVYVEDLLYQHAKNSGVKGSPLIICGPNVLRHQGNGFKYIATRKKDRIAFAEFDPNRAKEIAQRINDWSNTDLLCVDVAKLQDSYVFEDVDLMGTLKLECVIHKDRLTRQASKFKGELKGYIFTSSFRNGGGESEAFSHINDMLSVLDAEISGFGAIKDGFDKYAINLVKRKYVRLQVPVFVKEGRVKNFTALKYADGLDMITGLILYD